MPEKEKPKAAPKTGAAFSKEDSKKIKDTEKKTIAMFKKYRHSGLTIELAHKQIGGNSACPLGLFRHVIANLLEKKNIARTEQTVKVMGTPHKVNCWKFVKE